MQGRKRQKIRCGIWAEGDDTSWKILIDKEMNKGALCSKAKISKGTMAKMTNNEPVTLTVIEKICEVLQCDIGDVVQIVDIEKREKNNG